MTHIQKQTNWTIKSYGKKFTSFVQIERNEKRIDGQWCQNFRCYLKNQK